MKEDVGQEARDRKHGTKGEGRRRETGDVRQDTCERRRGTGGEGQMTGDRRYDTRDKSCAIC